MISNMWIHVLQLVAAFTVFSSVLYVYENERVILKMREDMALTMVKCMEETGQVTDKTGCTKCTNGEIQNTFKELEKIQRQENEKLWEQMELKLKEIKKEQTSLTKEVNDLSLWATEQKLQGFVTETSRDLVIIIDSSLSIGLDNFKQCLQDVATLLGLFCPKPDPLDSSKQFYNQIAVIKFSNDATEIFDFGKHHKLSDAQEAIKSTEYNNGTCTSTEHALVMAKKMFTKEKGSRSDSKVKKEVLLLTDGEYNCNTQDVVERAANELKAVANVYGLLVGIDSDEGRVKLAQITSDSSKNKLFVDSYSALHDLVSRMKQNIDDGAYPCIQ